MHYTDAIAQLRALGFIATKIGALVRITHKNSQSDLRYPINDKGQLPPDFDAWLTLIKKELTPEPTIADLKPGTRLRYKGSPFIWIVSENHGDRVTLVATTELDEDQLEKMEVVS